MFYYIIQTFIDQGPFSADVSKFFKKNILMNGDDVINFKQKLKILITFEPNVQSKRLTPRWKGN